MSKNIHPHPIKFSDEPKDFALPTPFIDALNLEKELNKRGLEIKLANPMKGGVISQIYEANMGGQKVVVKHTEDRSHSLFTPPFTPYDYFIDKESHNFDTSILQKLSQSTIKVPTVLHHFPDIFTTVMTDLRSDGSELMMDSILGRRLNLRSAKNMGTKLAELNRVMSEWEIVETPESAEQQIYQRGMELRLFYVNTQTEYLEMEKRYCRKDGQIIWTDGHPKNILVNESGDVSFIDFGRSHLGDKNFVLPNFLSHIALYSIAGYITKDDAINYITDAVSAYRQIDKIDEELFCKYFGMEILHRANGRWIAGIVDIKVKLRNIELGLTIFDDKIDTIEMLLDIVKKI